LLSVPLAAADKTSFAVDTKDCQQNEQPVAKKLSDEEEALEQLKKLDAAELALLKAGFSNKNHGRLLANEFLSYFQFAGVTRKDGVGFVQLNSNLAPIFDSVAVYLGEKTPNLSEINEPTAKVNKYFSEHRLLGFLWEPNGVNFASGWTRCKRSYGNRTECKTDMSHKLFAFLDKKLKESLKFLDDRINEKK
jgi:hypothetical protein